MFWDFITLRPETTYQVMILFSNRGTPKSHRFMNGYGSHTFKLVNKTGEAFWCKFIFKVVIFPKMKNNRPRRFKSFPKCGPNKELHGYLLWFSVLCTYMEYRKMLFRLSFAVLFFQFLHFAKQTNKQTANKQVASK